MGDEEKDGHESHLVFGKGQDGHGGDAGVNVGEHADKEREGGHGGEAQDTHERLEEEIEITQPSGPGEGGSK